MNVQHLTALITSFRAINEDDSISPESLGFILQQITDSLANADNALENYYTKAEANNNFTAKEAALTSAELNDLWIHTDNEGVYQGGQLSQN